MMSLSLKAALILANSAGPDEMQHHAAFHLGLHCLPKYPFRGIQRVNKVDLSKDDKSSVLPCLLKYMKTSL